MPRAAGIDRHWITEHCERFSESSGWPLAFTAVDGAERADVEANLIDNDECCWYREIHDGTEAVGYLHFTLPENPRNDATFLAVCELAEIQSELLNKLAAAEHALHHRNDELTTLVDIGRELPREEDLVKALEQLLRASVRLTGFRSTGFFLLDPARKALRLRVEHNLDGQEIPHHERFYADEPPDLKVLHESSLVVQRTTSSGLECWMPEGTATAVCMQVASQNGPIGSLWAFDRRERIPSKREIHVLESLAAQIATVIERVVLRKESETQHRLARELQVVTENQTGVDFDQFVEDDCFEAASRCLSRHEIGGDLCELIQLDEHRTLITIGDASGDSIPAAIVMTAVRGSLRTIASGPIEEALDTQHAVQRINRALHAITPAHQFMSFFYGVLDTRQRTFRYTNAGHPAPIVVPAAGGHSQLFSHGMLAGVSDDTEYGSSEIELQPGDAVVLFTDGIVEAMSRTRKMFRNDGIISSIEAASTNAAQELLQAIWDDFEDHSAGGSDPDDRSLMVVTMKPEPGE